MQIEMYKPDRLNLNEFIEFYKLQMILNNEIIKQGGFELQNYEELLEKFIQEVTKDPEAYLFDYEEIEPEDLDEAIYDYCIENLSDEIHQYFIIPERDVETWTTYTNYEIYYNEELDVYLLGISHWGMSWSFFFTEAPRPEYMRIKKYDEILNAGV